MELVLAYGSNMSVGQMADRCPGARLVGPARLDDHRLAFTRWSPRWEGGVGDVVAESGASVWGVVWSLDAESLATLDRYESHPDGYRRERMTIAVSDVNVSAWVYAVVDKRPWVRPAPDYLDVVLAAVDDHGLRAVARDAIVTAARAPD